MWTIFVEGLEFYGYHGVSPAERESGRRFRATMRCEIRGIPNPAADDVRNTLDYGQVAELILERNGKSTFNTVEALAWDIANEAFRRFKNLESVELEIAKVAPPIPAVVEAAGVWLAVTREDLEPRRR